MNIYESIGVLWIIFTAAVGHAALIWVVAAGSNRIKSRLDVGRIAEDAAIRDYRALNSELIIARRHE